MHCYIIGIRIVFVVKEFLDFCQVPIFRNIPAIDEYLSYSRIIPEYLKRIGCCRAAVRSLGCFLTVQPDS